MRYEFTIHGRVIIEADSLHEARDRFADMPLDEQVDVDVENLDDELEDCNDPDIRT